MEDSTPVCDIIIPVWNDWALTRACLASVKEKTSLPYRLIIIDNGSGEETIKGLEEIAANRSWKVILIRNQENLGFVRAVNQGLKASKAPFVCLLNNDVVVTEDWLEKMIRFAEKHPEAGLVTCLQNDPPGRKMPTDLDSFARTQVEEEGSYEELDHATGTCLLIKREVIEKIGYLDETFGLGQWEDNDLSRRAQQAGFRCYRLRDTYVWHHIGRSFRKISNWKEDEEKNREKFYHKWGRPLRIIYPVSEGIDYRRARFHQILQTTHALAREGCEVDLLVGKNEIDWTKEILPYYGLVRHQNLRIHTLPMLRSGEKSRVRISWNGVYHLAAWLKIREMLRRREYEVIYVRHLNLADFLLRWKGYFKIPVVFEAHEVFHLTTDRKDKAKKIQEMERRVYERLDGVVAISNGLAEDLREIFRLGAPMETIPDGVNLDLYLGRRGTVEDRKIVYVGQLYPWKGVGVLVDAMQYLPGWNLHVIGGGGAQEEALREKARKARTEDRVILHGQVSPGEVQNQLADAAVAILPLTRGPIAARYTSPLKLFEYMASGVPIVASDLPSVREILRHGENAVLVEPENPEALADGIRRMADRRVAERLAQKALEDVREFSWAKRAERIVKFLKGLKGHRC